MVELCRKGKSKFASFTFGYQDVGGLKSTYAFYLVHFLNFSHKTNFGSIVKNFDWIVDFKKNLGDT